MKLDFSFVNAELIMNLIKWGMIVGLITSVFFFIKNTGKTEQLLDQKTEEVKVVERKNEIKTDVSKIIGRVSADTEYRARVRDNFDAGEPR